MRTRSTCCLLVSGFLTEITQQIHSLRASGVMSSHFSRAAGSEMRTFRKSAGTLCTAPAEIAFLVIFLVTDLILHRYAIWKPSAFAELQLRRDKKRSRLRCKRSYGAPRKQKGRPRRPCTSLARIVWLAVQPTRYVYHRVNKKSSKKAAPTSACKEKTNQTQMRCFIANSLPRVSITVRRCSASASLRSATARWRYSPVSM